ncbi:hypothetical protein Bca4012_038749 [Brassica carinata]
MVEFYEMETETVESAIRTIRDSCHPRVDGVRDPGLEEEIIGSSSCGGEQQDEAEEFVGILSSLDIVAILDMKIPVSQVMNPNNTVLKQVDPGTRIITLLERITILSKIARRFDL